MRAATCAVTVRIARCGVSPSRRAAGRRPRPRPRRRSAAPPRCPPDTKETSTVAPLSGVRILAVEQLMELPFGTQILSDFGADIVGVEPVGYGGDEAVPWRMRTGRYK